MKKDKRPRNFKRPVIERRRFNYDAHIPERRVNQEMNPTLTVSSQLRSTQS